MPESSALAGRTWAINAKGNASAQPMMLSHRGVGKRLMVVFSSIKQQSRIPSGKRP
jgi:hypothetical protein